MTGRFKVKELSKVLRGIILVRCALVDREHAGLSVFGLVACLQTKCVDLVI